MSVPISYLVTTHNEGEQIQELFNRLFAWKQPDDEVVVLDDFSTDPTTQKIIDEAAGKGARILQHHLNNDYGEHKNWGTLQCKRPWIFQIDGDELPSEFLVGANLSQILLSNINIELYFVPRINDFHGVTLDHARHWGWRLDNSPLTGRPRVNFPDYQGRVYLNNPTRIKWHRRLHEKIEGHTTFAALPAEEDYALLHMKTIERQVETNLRYNKAFSAAENQGHNLV